MFLMPGDRSGRKRNRTSASSAGLSSTSTSTGETNFLVGTVVPYYIGNVISVPKPNQAITICFLSTAGGNTGQVSYACSGALYYDGSSNNNMDAAPALTGNWRHRSTYINIAAAIGSTAAGWCGLAQRVG